MRVGERAMENSAREGKGRNGKRERKRKASPEGGARKAIRSKVLIEPSIYSQTCSYY